jgi:hypothetical protein
MAVNPSCFGPKPQLLLATGLPAVGNQLFFYVAGSVNTKQNTYTNSTGLSANTNPVILNALGEPSTELWFTSGQSYKVVYAPSTDTDPPTSPIWTIDNVRGINDTSVTIDQWVSSGITPTYVGATSFTLPGDQTSTFQVGRRIKATVTAGTAYGIITASTYAALTTVTVVNDSTPLDSGLSAVSYGLLTPLNPSTPLLSDAYNIVAGSGDATKKLKFEIDGFTTATTRTATWQDKSGTVALLDDVDNGVQDFRLTLTSGVAVTTTDVTGAGTLYATAFKGNRIALYDGSGTWNIISTSLEFSITTALTAGKPYDVFAYNNSGTPTLEMLVWTNDTTRATALALQNGVLVKSGQTTRRYLGTIYTSGANTMEDSYAKRYVFNYYNRVDRPMRAALETADSWNYTTATWRQANANTANQLDCVIGVSEDPVTANVTAIVGNTNAGVFPILVGVGVDSTSANSTTILNATMNQIVNGKVTATATYNGFPGVGRHTLVWLEYSVASGTTTWYGDNGTPTLAQSGIIGTVKQ